MLVERFRKLEEKWRKTLVIVNWFMVFIATIIGLLPIFMYYEQQRRGYPSGYFADLLVHTNFTAPVDSATVRSVYEDDFINVGTDNNFGRINAPYLGMCLPALVDLLVEVYVGMTHSRPATETVRLTNLERFVFIVGVAFNGVYLMTPSNWNVMVIFTVRDATDSLISLLAGAPIIMFLERTTNVFSPFFTTFVIFLLSVGNGMAGFSVGLPPDTPSYQVIIDCYTYTTLAAIVLILASCLWSFLQFLFSQRDKAVSDGTKNQQLDPFQNFSKTHVPARHMVTLCLAYVIGVFFFSSTSKIPQGVKNFLYAVLLLLISLVFVIEQRVRVNDVEIGLVQVDIKQKKAMLAETAAALNASIAEQEKAAKEREMQLTRELQENIANSAHDMKSPTCALSLAVDSLVSAFAGKTSMDKDGCKKTLETLMGMMHTLASLNTIINRSVDASSKITGHALLPNESPIEIRRLVEDVVVFMRWQAENSSLAVKLEPFPEHLPTNILADMKWLREDLLCVAANALKFSQERSKVPIVVRVTVDADDDDITMPSMLSFSFLDSGHHLSEDRYSTLFDYPKMRSSERLGMGGMGLGLYCLRERATAMGGQCGARKRRDGLEGTEVWFGIPLVDADADADANITIYDMPLHINRTSSLIQSPIHQEVNVLGKNTVDLESTLKSSSHHFVVALGGAKRSTSSAPSDTASPSTRVTLNRDDETLPTNRGTIDALISKRRQRAKNCRHSTDVSPLNSLKQSFDRISEEKGGVTLPILIVDDSIAILKMIKRSILNELPDLVIKEARDGHEAFDRVQEETNGFHIIITDIQMPNCDGFDFTYRVREHESRKRLPATMIIGMSANYQEKIVSQSVRCGMDGFLHKPYQLETLVDVINHVQLHRDLTKQMETMKEIEDTSTRYSSMRNSSSRHASSRHSQQAQLWKKATPASTPRLSTTSTPRISMAAAASVNKTPPRSPNATLDMPSSGFQFKRDAATARITTMNPMIKGSDDFVSDNTIGTQPMQWPEEATEEEHELALLPFKNNESMLFVSQPAVEPSTSRIVPEG